MRFSTHRTLAVIVPLLAGGFALGCEEQPAQPSSETAGVQASHGNTGVFEATAVYRAVNSTAAANHGLRTGEKVGTLSITDDGMQLSITGSAEGLVADADERYVSLFYDKAASAQGPEACEPGRNVGIGTDHPLSLTILQMVIGPGANSNSLMVLGLPHAAWEVDPGGNATIGNPNPESTLDYVPADRIGTVSIRDVTVDGPIGSGTGPEAVVACGKVTHDPASSDN